MDLSVIDTLLFVDVDGVLNIGVKDPGRSSLSLSKLNVASARRLWGLRDKHPDRGSIERLVNTCARRLEHEESGTYEKYLSDADTCVSDILVGRLAALIHCLEGRGLVVLSSSWRKHAARVAKLENAIALKLGKPFSFHATTSLRDVDEDNRLQAIGDFISSFCDLITMERSMQVLVLDDFHASPVGKWKCEESIGESIVAAQEYLENRAPPWIEASVCIVHTYDEFTTPDGLLVQLGSGLTQQHFSRALDFLCDCSSGDGSTAHLGENEEPFMSKANQVDQPSGMNFNLIPSCKEDAVETNPQIKPEAANSATTREGSESSFDTTPGHEESEVCAA